MANFTEDLLESIDPENKEDLDYLLRTIQENSRVVISNLGQLSPEKMAKLINLIEIALSGMPSEVKEEVKGIIAGRPATYRAMRRMVPLDELLSR